MSTTSQPLSARAGVAFELERFALEDGRLVVSGHWSGVRGMRFVRPTLVIGDREVLATLEHKPWAPGGEEAWAAAFPWDGDAVDAEDAVLAVAPTVIVPLVATAGNAPLLRAVAEKVVAPPARFRAAVEEEVVVAPPARSRAAAAAEEDIATPPAATGRAVKAPVATPPAAADARVRELEDDIRDLRADIAALTRQRDALRADLDHAAGAADRDRERATAQRDEAVQGHEAAVRSRARMEAECDAAVAGRRDALAERDEAVAQRDTARDQREEVLLAHGALQRRLDGELAGQDRGSARRSATSIRDDAPIGDGDEWGRHHDTSIHDDGEWTDDGDTTERDGNEWARDAGEPGRAAAPDTEAPIGVRAIPAARAVGGALHRAQRGRSDMVTFDLWAIRVFGTIAAVCFILLLVLLLRVLL